MEVSPRVADGFRDSIDAYGIRPEAESLILGLTSPIVLGSIRTDAIEGPTPGNGRAKLTAGGSVVPAPPDLGHRYGPGLIRQKPGNLGANRLGASSAEQRQACSDGVFPCPMN